MAREQDREISNQRSWNTRSAAVDYRDENELFPCEKIVFGQLKTTINQSDLLDIGVGTGRTTGHLARDCKNYIGVDYSTTMLARAKERYPWAEFRLMDARDLSGFADGSFDFVLFSFNGIDYVDHKGRMAVMKEVRRVLRPNGLFLFSAHWRGARVRPAYHPRNIILSRNFGVTLRSSVGYVKGILNAAMMGRRAYSQAEYQMVNDSASYYSLLTYYITPKAQASQLYENGFDVVQLWDFEGSVIEATDSPPNSPSNFMVYYLARVSGA